MKERLRGFYYCYNNSSQGAISCFKKGTVIIYVCLTLFLRANCARNCLCYSKIFQYLSNSALAYTSVASTTVLTSTSGLFTLFFGALIGQDTVNAAKITAVFISMAGVAMTTVGKTWAPDEMLSLTE